jgi:hypothetical protein
MQARFQGCVNPHRFKSLGWMSPERFEAQLLEKGVDGKHSANLLWRDSR